MKVHNYKIKNNSEQAEGATCETCRKITLNGIGLLSGAQLKYSVHFNAYRSYE